MARNASRDAKNRELHERWVALNEKDPNDRGVQAEKRRLGNEVIRENEPMLEAAIRQYTARTPDLRPDLFDTAAAQLWRVFQTWDPDRASLMTHAKTYISGAVRREVGAHDHPHLSYDDFTLRGKIVKDKANFLIEHEREPTNTELAEISGVPESKLAILFSGKPLSLDQPAPGADEETTLGAIVAAEAGEEDVQSYDNTEFSLDLDPDVAAAADPIDLVAYLMRQGDGAGQGSRSPEIGYLLGLPDHGKSVPKRTNQLSLQNAHTILVDLLEVEPTPEQLSMAAGVTQTTAATYLAEKV